MERFALFLLPTIIIVTVVSSILIIMKDDQAELEGDVEKLLRKPSPRLSNMVRDEFLHPNHYHHACQVTEQPESEEEKWRGDGGDSLEKSETGDSGTCVDEILSPGPLGASKEEERKEEEEEEYEEVFEGEDLVQLTVSSLASLGMLEDVPEHADEDNSELADEQATVGFGMRKRVFDDDEHLGGNIDMVNWCRCKIRGADPSVS